MATFKKHGLRGSILEDLINLTISKYREGGLALIQKVPTPITPVSIDPESRHITLAYFDQKSTVDYIGVCQGVPICFDAKEVHVDTFPMINVHDHQMKFMEDFEAQDGIAFFILYYAHKDEFYYVTYKEMKKYWDRACEGGRKSFTYDELDKNNEVRKNGSVPVHFLPTLQKDILSR